MQSSAASASSVRANDNGVNACWHTGVILETLKIPSCRRRERWPRRKKSIVRLKGQEWGSSVCPSSHANALNVVTRSLQVLRETAYAAAGLVESGKAMKAT